jgi:acetolactate synthase regulatory subunit
MGKVKCSLRVECNHSPETIDRVVLPVRKRGLSVTHLEYKQLTDTTSVCNLSFEIEESDIVRVCNNLIRQTDVLKVEQV